MNLIVACDLDWHIGRAGELLFRISDDMKRFRALTTGHPVILGRKTLATFPGGRPLANRLNLILSRNTDFQCPGATVVRNLTQLSSAIEDAGDPDAFVIGGEEVYRQLLPYCRLAYVTRVLERFPADRDFPNLDEHPDWQLIEAGPLLTADPLSYRFCLYENRHVRQLP